VVPLVDKSQTNKSEVWLMEVNGLALIDNKAGKSAGGDDSDFHFARFG
jgi:hypothetical protein